MEEYQPREPDPMWMVLHGLVMLLVAAYCPATKEMASSAALVAFRFLSWLYSSPFRILPGMPLTIEKVAALPFDIADRWIASTTTRLEKGAQTNRAWVRRMLIALHPSVQLDLGRRPLVNPPYTLTELLSLRQVAESQNTKTRARVALLAYALSVGAGGDQNDLWQLDGSCVDLASSPIKTSFPETGLRSARTVPLNIAVEAMFHKGLAIAESQGRDPLGPLFGPKVGARDYFLRELVNPTKLGFSPTRFRRSYILSHLVAGTQIPDILYLAGTHSARIIDDLLPFMPPSALNSATIAGVEIGVDEI